LKEDEPGAKAPGFYFNGFQLEGVLNYRGIQLTTGFAAVQLARH
jgi:hypothetical protein